MRSYDQAKKILVVRRDNIGDLVCTTPAFSALRRHYPSASIAALVNSYNADVLRNNPNVDHVFIYQKSKHAYSLFCRIKAFFDRVSLIMRIRRWGPDITILAKSSYDRHGLNFARLIGSKNIIGVAPTDFNRVKSLPDIHIPHSSLRELHEVEAINKLLKPLSISDAVGPLQLFPDVGVVTELKKKLLPARKRIALHISAREKERRWGSSKFIQLVNYILKTQPETQILLFWSPGKGDDRFHPGDDDKAAKIIHAVNNKRLLPVPCKNLVELTAGISLCDLFVGCDGGALHISAGLGKPCVAMFENQQSKIRHWYPWLVDHLIVTSMIENSPNIENITENQIISAIKNLTIV